MAVQGASSSSLSSSTPWWTYDVFLSFRGEDTRQNFTSHLHQALDRKKIYTYIDYKLQRGQEISDELLKAIESSRISIVVLSKNYASSRWCLDELMKILECKKTKQQKVLPVFYDVDRTEVRHQREVFGKALAKLKERFKDESKVERWKAALTEVAGLSGFTLGERTEAELIQEIVREISKVVKPKYLNDVAKHPVGMESRLHDVHDILLRVGGNDIRILGIYGIGGVGKTTLAKVIYNTFTDQFENCCFLANVRETSKREDGLIQLQETLLCEILGDWSLKVRNKDEGMGRIKKMLWSKRVLLVLDDLDQSVKVETLLGGYDWFGLGSLIIITTRNEHLLTRNNVHLRYKVKELDPDKALQLFRWNAFRNPNPNPDFEEITENVLHYVGGLPLALMVVGSDLFGRDIHYWRSALEKYKKIPHKDIFKMLKISYDGLDESEKNIFLDIACFFVGKGEEYVTKILDGCGFFANCGIRVLVDKSLITIEGGILIMHDLLKDMGREIVRQESPEEPEKRSRLWFHEDVRRVLEETKGTITIEGILLDIPEGHDDKQIRLHPKAFKKMKNLRLFINRNAQFSGGPPNYLPNEIRVLDWSEYLWSVLPSNFNGTKLIEFRMINILIKELGGLKSKNLTQMNLSGFEFLTKIPDLSSCPNLEKLDVEYCENLVEVHDSVGFLDKVSRFSASGCYNLTILPKRFKLRSLRYLSLRDCGSLEDFPEIECEMEFLHELDFEGTSLKILPLSIGNLTRLEELDDRDCKNLLLLPNLENLDLGDCENLDLSKEVANLAGEHLEDRSIAYTSSSMAFSLPSFSSASTSSTLNWSYDVFLSFRGIDTRNTFTAFLYSALCQRGIKTYIDDKDLGRGETISPTLMKVIEDSMISIIILSPNYASSISCLEELVKILECKKTKQQIVLPVFYHVDPSDVRHLRGRFGEALAKHQERFKEDPKVQKWKESLQEVAGLSREHLEDGNESEFMQKIIEWVDSKIESTYQLDIAEHPIGLESRLKDLNTKLLEIERNDITLMIGIYGTGGIGKSTLAKAIFNSIGRQFEARCFLANVREKSSPKDDLGQLQEKLLYELLGNSKSSNIGNFEDFNVIKHRLCSKRVLIILDDVNELWQLKELAGNHNWFGPGSRIVITTRDQHLLTHHKVDSTYEVQGLDDNQAIQLFSLHAFERDNPVESYEELTKAIIGYAKGLPLALVVLGSYLRGRSIQEWESALKKYERSPHKDIYEILKISYDGLDDDEKNIFLDIACFFKGKSVEYVTKILDSRGFSSYFSIARLKDKCLINIRSQCVEMHDLLQGMGKEIVRQESPKEAGKRSRLWFHEEVRRVLEENSGTNTIEGILLDFPGGDDKICLHSETFMKMENLRLFINRNAQFSRGRPNYLPNEIRVLDWPEYPSSFLPSEFDGRNLVEFQMPNSLIKELRSLKSKNLTVMDLRSCKFITKIPDLSSSPNLENLDLGDCENLVEVHHSVGFLDKLSSFSVSGCRNLRIFPKRFKLRSLRFFDFKYCCRLEDFPEIECEMEFLHKLDFLGTSIKELPSSIENLKGLEKLYLDRSSLKKLPSSIGNLTRLQELYAAGSSSSAIWKSLQVSNYFPALVELDISGSDIVIFPAQSVRFASLRHLWLNNCKKLEEILPLPLSISTVKARECTSLESFALLSDILIKNNETNFSNFLRIDLYRCHKLHVNMRLIPSWEERHSEEQNCEDRYVDIVFPGKRIPSWFSYRKEAHDSNLCEIDINRPHHWNDIDEIVLYVVLGFRVGITDPITDDAYITVKIHDGSDWKDLYTRDMTFSWTDSDHVWMLWKSYDKEVDASRFRFECDAAFMVFRRVGIHFLKKHEDHTGDEGGDWGLDFMDETRHSSFSELENDNENPKEDLKLENDDENPKERFGKRHRGDEYDFNMEPNWYPQQKRQHSSTMGIRIMELENDDEDTKQDFDSDL